MVFRYRLVILIYFLWILFAGLFIGFARLNPAPAYRDMPFTASDLNLLLGILLLPPSIPAAIILMLGWAVTGNWDGAR